MNGIWSYVGVYRDYELESKLLKGGYTGDFRGEYRRGSLGDTRSLDHDSYYATVPSKYFLLLCITWWRNTPT